MNIRLKSKEDIEELKVSGAILRDTLRTLSEEAKIGVTLKHLDARARALIKERGAEPTFLGYTPEGAGAPYPAAICASVNETIVHGIPNDYSLKDGDILSIDLGVTYHGFVTDAAVTVGIGTISEEAKDLIETTKRSLELAIRECEPGKRLGDIGYIIEKTAKMGHFSVINGLTGHGVGFELHEDPSVYNYGSRGEGMKLVPGLVIAIEPMFSAGSPNAAARRDGSFVTKDKSLSAHFEHSIAITEDGYIVLTA